jgi:glycosyltransferase involved in cell wall biosynthesis
MIKKLSIIIPMYNVASYLERCIGSVYNLGLNQGEFEIILVNDESPDNSLAVATSLTKDKKNVKIISQKNKGLGGARNTGLKNAEGQYVLFLDADDILILQDYNFLFSGKELYQLGSKNVSTEFKILSSYTPPNIESISGIDFWSQYEIIPSACNKIYKRVFLLKYDLFFKEQIYSEDIEFNTRVMFYVQKLESRSDVLQYFIQSPNSITRNVSTIRQKKLFNDLKQILKLLLSFKKYNSKSQKHEYYFNRVTADLGLGLINFGLKTDVNLNEVKEIKDILRSNGVLIYKMDYYNRNKRLFKIIIRIPFSLQLLRLIYKK